MQANHFKKCLLLLAFLLVVQMAFAQVPFVSSFAPASGPAGTSVTINGTNFSAVATENVVFFGATRAVVKTSSTTSLVVTVPANSTFKPVSVTVKNLTGYSAKPFIVTYAGATGAFNAASFGPKTDISVNVTTAGPNEVFDGAVGDFDGDGLPDLAIADGTEKYIAIYKNTGNAAVPFNTKPTSRIGNGTGMPYSIAVGDIDGDGKLDIVVADLSSYNVTIYKNSSDPGVISFFSKTTYSVGNSPYQVVIGDMDSDGKPDLIVANYTSKSVSVLKNATKNGAVSFADRVDFAIAENASGVAVGDLDGDGKLDIAVSEYYSKAVSVLRNISTGTTLAFASKSSFATPDYAYNVSIADIDGDGKPDLAVGNVTRFISVFRNSCSTGVISFASNADYGSANGFATNPQNIQFADMDGDGKIDMAVPNSNTKNISIYRNASSSGTIVFDAAANYTAGGQPQNVLTGDLNGDGKPDLVVPNYATGNASVLINTRGTAAAPTVISFAPATASAGQTVAITGTNLTGVTAVTFGGVAAKSFTVNSATSISAVVGAGASGMVAVTGPGGTVSLTGFVYNGPAAAVPVITSITPETAAYGKTISIIGTNFSTSPTGNTVYFGGVKATVTTAAANQLKVTVPYGAINASISVTANGLTAYSGKAFIPGSTGKLFKFDSTSFEPKVNFATDKAPRGILTADLDGDGKVDIVNLNYEQYTGNTITINRNTSTKSAIAFGNKTVINTGSGTTAIAAGDINGDGKLDLVVSHGDEVPVDGGKDKNYVTIYINNSTAGNMSFTAAGEFKSLGAADMIVVKDLDGDGRPEVVVWSNVVIVLKNQSSGNTVSFAPYAFIDKSQSSETNIIFTDVDGDNKPDLVLAQTGISPAKGTLTILKNTSTSGAISFAPLGKYPLIDNLNGRLAAADFDGDGKTDFAITSSGSNTVSVFKNTSASATNITFSRVDYPSGKFPSRVEAADLNGDGTPDLVVTNSNSYTVSVLGNTTVKGKPITFDTKIDYGANTIPSALNISDLDNDGMPDLVVGYPGLNNYFAVLRNNMVTTPPVITSFTPASTTQSHLVTITGTYFTGATSVSFGGVPAEFTVASATTIHAVLGKGASGNVVVTTPFGTATLKGFVYLAEPYITSFSPASAKKGDVVTFKGTGFADVNKVSFGSVNASSFRVLSDTVVTAIVGNGSSGKILVSNGISSSTAGPFTFLPTVPVVTSFNPTAGGKGTTVVIKGTNFTGKVSVTFGGIPAQLFNVTSPTEISAVVEEGATGEVAVTTDEGKGSLSGFYYVPKPVITANGPTTFTNGGKVTLAVPITRYALYQWFKNDIAIANANSPSYVATESGLYKVTATVDPYSISSDPIEVKNVFTLPATNFKVSAQSLTCKGQQNGGINIEAVKSYNYKASVTGPSGTANYSFANNKLAVDKLSAGEYNVCITIADEPDYQQCFTVVVTEPEDLAVYIAVNKSLNTVTLSLAGSNSYEVHLNDKVIRTSDRYLNLPLNNGSNRLSVNTALPCQGVFEQIINITGNHAPYPSPFVDILDINIGEAVVKTAQITIYDVANGRQVFTRSYYDQSGIVRLDVSGFKTGVYSVHLVLDKFQSVYKIVKK